jgi:DNA repair ATPase RecN
MLTELRIRNLAVIESVTLPVAPGFNVLSGETGAGKSIIVGALGLLLGERSSADVVRTGSDKAVVEGVFDGSGNRPLQALLDEKGIEAEDGLLVLRREVFAKVGAVAWDSDWRSNEILNESDTDLMLGGGVDWMPSDRLSVRLAYQDIDMDIRSVTLGAAFHF